MESYDIGDAVWALIPEYHYWPGLVDEAKEGTKALKKEKSSDDIFIYFIGLASYGWIPKSNILPYQENKEKFKSDCYQYLSGIDNISASY